MSNTDKNASEEVDLGQLFRAIINLFRQLFTGVSNILLKLYSLFIYSLKLVIEYYKIVIPCYYYFIFNWNFQRNKFKAIVLPKC